MQMHKQHVKLDLGQFMAFTFEYAQQVLCLSDEIPHNTASGHGEKSMTTLENLLLGRCRVAGAICSVRDTLQDCRET